MAQTLEWIVALRDSITEPARRAKESVESVRQSIARLKSDAREKIGLNASAAKVAAGVKYGADGKLRDAVTGRFISGGSGVGSGVAAGADSANQSIMGLAKSVSTLVTMKLAEWGYAAAKALLSVGAGAVSFAIESASFKRNMIASLELIEGTSEKAQETFTKINAIADTTPFETQKVMDMFKSLRSAGMGQDAAEKMFMALSDIASVQGAAKDEMLDRLKLAVIKIKGTGKLDMETLLQLSEAGSGAGINVESILKAVAAKRGVSFEAARAALSSGQIKWEEAFQALQAATVATVNKGKELGTATKIFGTGSFEGALSTLKSKLDDIFSDIDISPVINGIQTLAGMMTFSVGKDEIVTPLKQAMLDLKGVVERTFGAIFKAFGELTTEDALTSIVLKAIPVIEFFGNTIASVVTGVVTLGGAFASGFGQAYRFVGAVGEMDRSGSTIKDLVPTFTSIGRAIGGVIGMVISYLSIIGGAWQTILSGVKPAIEWLDNLITSEEQLGGGFAYVSDIVKAFAATMSAILSPAITIVAYLVGGIVVAFQRAFATMKPMISAAFEWAGAGSSATSATSAWQTTISVLTSAAQIAATVLGLLGYVMGFLVGVAVQLAVAIGVGIIKIGEGLVWIGEQVFAMISWIGEQIYGFVSTVFPEATKIGTSIVQGIWEGIKAAWGWLKSSVGKLVGELPGIGLIQDKLGVQQQSVAESVTSPRGGGTAIAPTSPFEAIAPTGATQGLGQRGVEQSNTFSLTMPIVVSASGDPASVASAVQQGATSAAPGVSQAFAALAAQYGAG